MKLKTKININFFVYLSLALFMILNSGSMLQSVYGEAVQQINFVIFIVVALYLCLTNKSDLLKIRLNTYTVFLLVTAVFSMLCMVMWSEYSLIILYVSNYASFFLCYRIARKISYEKFTGAFINIMMAVSVISIIGWAFSDLLLKSQLGMEFNRYMQYKSFLIFNIIKTAPSRNCGIFWEPGMFQGFLNFAVLLIILKKRIALSDYAKIAVLAFTVYTTFSTSGYIVLALLAILLVYRLIHSYNRAAAIAVVIICGLIFIITDGFSTIINWAFEFLPRQVTQKIIDQNISYTTRLYTIWYDIELSLRYPFGVGRYAASDMIQNLAQVYGYAVNARTSTITTAFINYGFLTGLFYLYMWVKGCFSFVYKKIHGDIVYFILILTAMMILLNSEPMLFHVFFNAVLVYWLGNHSEVTGVDNESIMAE